MSFNNIGEIGSKRIETKSSYLERILPDDSGKKPSQNIGGLSDKSFANNELKNELQQEISSNIEKENLLTAKELSDFFLLNGKLERNMLFRYGNGEVRTDEMGRISSIIGYKNEPSLIQIKKLDSSELLEINRPTDEPLISTLSTDNLRFLISVCESKTLWKMDFSYYGYSNAFSRIAVSLENGRVVMDVRASTDGYIQNTKIGYSNGTAALNKAEGCRRENEVFNELNSIYSQNDGYTILRERVLCDRSGNETIDVNTGEKRRIDFVVLKGEKVVKAIEVTSLTAPKLDQMAKELRIRTNGGSYIKDYDGKVIHITDDILTEVERRA